MSQVSQMQKEVYREIIMDAEKAGLLKYCAHGVAVICLPEDSTKAEAAPVPGPETGPLFDNRQKTQA